MGDRKEGFGWFDACVSASFLAVCPFLLFPSRTTIFTAALFPVLALIRKRKLGAFLPPNPLNLLVLNLLTLVCLSAWVSYDLDLSLGKIGGTILGGLLFLTVSQVAVTPRRLGAVCAIFVASGAMLATSSFFLTSWKTRFAALADLRRLASRTLGPLGDLDGLFNPNPVGGSMVLLFPVILCLLAAVYASTSSQSGNLRRGSLWLLGGCLLLVLCVLILSESYSAWISFLVAVSTLVWGRISRHRWSRPLDGRLQRSMQRSLVLAPALALLISLVPAFGTFSYKLPVRALIWEASLPAAQDFAWTGMGMNSFRRVVNVLYPILAPGGIDRDLASTHNILLQSVVDLGMVGLIAHVALWSAVIRMLWLTLDRAESVFARRLALGLLAGLTGQWVYQTVDVIPLGAKLGIFWWFAVAISAALFRSIAIENPSLRRESLRVPTWGIWLSCACLGAASMPYWPWTALALSSLAGALLGVLNISLWMVAPSRSGKS